MVEAVYEFFDIEPYTLVTREMSTASGRSCQVTNPFPQNFPSIAGFASKHYIAKSTVYLWAKSHKEFSDALDWARAKQEELLLILGLNSDYNSTITKLMLINNHGYKDKMEQVVDTTQPVVINYERDSK